MEYSWGPPIHQVYDAQQSIMCFSSSYTWWIGGTGLGRACLEVFKKLYMDVPTGLWNLDFWYLFLSLLTIHRQFCIKNIKFCSNWVLKIHPFYVNCDPTWANEALWGRYQNWHLKFNILFNIQGTFWHQNNFHIIFLSKVIDNLISNCLITLKINYQDMGRQSYWFVHKPIEVIENNGLKHNFLSIIDKLEFVNS